MIVAEPEPKKLPERGNRMIHHEHLERRGEAWCGAPVLGVRGHFGGAECVVCIDLRRVARRS